MPKNEKELHHALAALQNLQQRLEEHRQMCLVLTDRIYTANLRVNDLLSRDLGDADD